MRYRFRGADIEADADLGEEALELRPKKAGPLAVRYSDIDAARAEDYRIHLTIHPGGEPVELYHLAKKFEGFCEELFEKRNAALVRELFLADRRRIATFKGRIERKGAPVAEGRIDLFPRTLVFFPRWSDPFFFRIADIEAVTVDRPDYRVTLREEEPVTLSYLGLRFEEFQERLKRTREAMERRCRKLLEALVPGSGGLAPQMLDGRAIPVPGPLEGLLCGTEERQAAYRHLKSIATAPLWIGLKEIGGDDTDELKDDPEPGEQHLLWYYAPVRGLSIHEVASEEDHATYVYRAEIPKINRAWAMVQFRRDVLVSPDKYPVAYRKLPRLREVSQALVGRAIHNESWAERIKKLLD